MDTIQLIVASFWAIGALPFLVVVATSMIEAAARHHKSRHHK